MMRVKKWLSFFLSAVTVVAGMFPATVSAANMEQETKSEKSESVCEIDALEFLPDHEDLFSGYVENLFLGNYGISVYGDYAEEKLTGLDLAAYRLLKEQIQEIAAGERANTQITLTLKDLGITKTQWTAEDLGVSKLAELVNGRIEIDSAATEAMWAKITPNFNQILNYLLVDCPYDFYWYDKTSPTGSAFNKGISVSTQDGVNFIFNIEGIGLTYSFPVAQEYEGASDYTVNALKLQTVQTAVENAKAIVEKYSGYSDYDKLSAYKREICELTEYNTAAAEDQTVAYGNPWQLIWVFDGDESTRVVCEGYSKAFQYLCDMSDFFNEDIRCYTVSGTMDGGTGAGAHMWNIVTMDDQKNYITDVTNCDGNSIGADDKLFLAGAEKSTSGGYVVTIGGYSVTYAYSEQNPDIPGMYGDILQIAPENYKFEYVASGTFGGALGWTLDKDGYLNIKGNGAMPEPEPEAGDEVDLDRAPWSEYKSEIKRVVIEEGITSVSMLAFSLFGSIEEISLPESLTKIGQMAFAGSNIKNLKLPENLQTIDAYAFYLCRQLQEIRIPQGTQSISFGAFSDCISLQELTIPASVTQIGAEAFKNCSSLKDLWFLGDCPKFVDAVDENGEPLGSAFADDTLTLHYCIKNAESWQETVLKGFEDAEVHFDVFCGENESDHDWEAEATVDEPATCVKEGTASVHCKNCDAVKVQVLPVTDHSYGDWETTKESGCTEKGERQRVCQVCSHTETEEIPADGHHWETEATVDEPATCEKGGTASVHCKNCDVVKDLQDIPATGHSYGDWETTKESGCTEKGERQRICQVCSHTETEEIPADGHRLMKTENEDSYTCTVCGKKFADAEGKTELTGGGSLGGGTENPDQDPVVNPDVKPDVKPDQTPVGTQSKILVNRISISGMSKKIAAGKKISLSAKVFPANAVNKAVKWTSDNPKYAMVSSKGVVTTKAAGKGKSVTIRATAADGSKVTAVYKIKLMQNAVTKVKIQNAKKTLKAGGTMKLKAAVSKNGPKANVALCWTTSNEKYASVNSKGVVKAKKAGKRKTVKITAMATDGSGRKSTVKIKIQ